MSSLKYPRILNLRCKCKSTVFEKAPPSSHSHPLAFVKWTYESPKPCILPTKALAHQTLGPGIICSRLIEIGARDIKERVGPGTVKMSKWRLEFALGFMGPQRVALCWGTWPLGWPTAQQQQGQPPCTPQCTPQCTPAVPEPGGPKGAGGPIAMLWPKVPKHHALPCPIGPL